MKLSGTHSASMNGPVPASVFWRSPEGVLRTAVFSTIEALPLASPERIDASGYLRWRRTVDGSSAITPSTASM